MRHNTNEGIRNKNLGANDLVFRRWSQEGLGGVQQQDGEGKPVECATEQVTTVSNRFNATRDLLRDCVGHV